MNRRTLIAAILVPVFLLALVVLQFLFGGNSLPNWISSITIRQAHDPMTYLRVIMITELFLAMFCFVLGRNAVPVAWIALLLVCFTSIAEVSAIWNRSAFPDLVGPFCVIAISLGLGIMLAGTSRPEGDSPPTRIIRWVTFGILALIGISVIINVPLTPRTFAEGRRLEPPMPNPGEGVSIHTLDVNSWEGLRVDEINLSTFMPNLPVLTAEGRMIIVLYNIGCGDCHDFFDVHFSEGYHLPVIAIKIPNADGAVLSSSARTDDVVCPSCTFTSLPQGPLWLVRPPVVMLIEDGRIVCIDDELHERCLDEA
jgi:hypothetical protein